MRKLTSPVAITALSIATIAVVAPPAHAGVHKSKKPHSSAGLDGNTLYAASNISLDLSKNGSGSNSGPVSVVASTDWTPPACWYAPAWTPKEFKKSIEGGYESVATDPTQPDYAKRSMAQLKHRYKDGKYKNYNLDKQGDGMWWGAVENPNEPDVLKRMACNTRLPFWVKNGVHPDVPRAISPEILAGLAYQQIKVPGTNVDMNPDGEQTVNLDTWIWSDDGKFKPVSVTASVDGLGISATTTAVPRALHLDAGTEDATLHPSSGTCPIGKDGTVGNAYTKGGSDETPPCGLTYLRASGSSPYQLQATITWKVSWAGTGGAGGDLPSGTFRTTQPVDVQEIQSIVR